jgi:peptidase S41-like protein
MLRRALVLCCLATVVATMSVSAQTPAGTPTPVAPAIPTTAAGSVLRAWLDAFNTGDTARMDAFYRQYQPEENAAAVLPFREEVGGFDLVTIEKSAPRHVEFTVKERKGARTAYGIIDLAPTEPRITGFPLLSLGENGSAATVRVDAAARARAIDGAAAMLDSFYVFPDVAKRLGDSLRARRARGAYDSETNGIAFSVRLHNELREISHDKHLGVRYSVRPLPPQPSGPRPPTPDQIARQREQMDQENCGFVRAERLDGNVGYLKFNFFADTSLCGATASAAMNFLAGTRALIVDMRDNGGGSPPMVAYVTSYLFSTRTHINDLWTRRTGTTQEFWTRDDVPGRKFGGEKPVYVLTSSHTFSGAEEFTYNLKNLKRATIIGETTGGGAHPVSGHRIDDHFMIAVPFARAVNPISHTNWEGVGVEPDVKVPAAEALATAQKMIRDKSRP